MTNEIEIRTDALWSFETDRFFVGFYAEPEETDPADSFCFDEDIEAVRSGAVDWFCAVVRVFLKSHSPYGWKQIGADYLGGCAYKNVSDFYNDRAGYFPDMIRAAIADARSGLRRLGEVSATMRQAA